MFDKLRADFLRLMRVPHDPTPPAGAPASVRVFRASDGFYYLKLMGWGVTQVFAVAGIVFWIGMLENFERNVNIARQQVQRDAAAKKAALANAATTPPPASAPAEAVPVPISAPAPEIPAIFPSTPATATASPAPAPAATKKKTSRNNRNVPGQLAQRMPWWLIPLMKMLEGFGIAGFIFQLPLTYAVLRLEYELRWYIVTDRSLRIRSGIWRLQEITMSFANIQQVSVTQGPIQRLLKISDVRVQSAGGGGGEHGSHGHGGGDTLHTGIFHGVDNAQEIRDLILERLRLFRATGLGDPDEAPEPASAATTHATGPHPALAAARELLEETRALRAAL